MLRTARPWRDLPPDLAELVSGALAAPVPDDITAMLAPMVVEQLGPGSTAVNVREDVHAGVAQALRRFPRLVGRDEPALTPPEQELYADIGANEAREGRSLEMLLAIYRTGARLLLDAMLAALDEHGRLELRTVSGLTSAVFAFADAVVAASAEGYASDSDARSAERQWRCRRLATQLLEGVADTETVELSAKAAGWQVPDRVQVVLAREMTLEAALDLLGSSALVVERECGTVAIVTAPFDPTVLDEAAPKGVVLGTEVPVAELPASLHLAERTATISDLAAADGTPLPRLLHADERLGAIAVSGDPTALAALAERRLAPLAQLRDGQRERLLETLHAWIRHWGRRADVAAELDVHPQTIGYRMGTLRSVLGDDLEDPTALHELALVLGAWADAHQPLPPSVV